MGIRPDMTPQAARIDAHYLRRDWPTRLCYLGHVIHTRQDEFAGSREPLQVGAELFGHNGAESDLEILDLMVSTLALVGLQSLHVDLGHVGIFQGLAEQAKLSDDQITELFDALQRKARSEVEELVVAWQLDKNCQQMIAGLVDLNGDATVLEQADTLFADANKTVIQALAELKEFATLTIRRMPQLTLYYDLAEISGYSYYTGTVFSVFIPGHGKAIAKGGRYDGIGQSFGRSRPATGFSADLRQMLNRVADDCSIIKGIMAPYSEDPAATVAIEGLRANGERVIVQLPGCTVEPMQMGCDRVLEFKNGKWVLEHV